jgi:hypothetical protein
LASVRNLLLAALLLLAPAAEARMGFRSSSSAPQAGAVETIRYPRRLLHVTDTHVNWAFFNGSAEPWNGFHFGKFVDSVLVMAADPIGVDAFVLGGDWSWDSNLTNNRANADSFEAIIGRLEGAGVVVWAVIGNHEITAADTLAGRSPHHTASERFGGLFRGRRWYATASPTVRFFALNNNANVDIGSYTDYDENNPPTVVPPPGGIQGYDFDGITVPGSTQRADFRNFLAGSRPDKWNWVGAHRAIYGTESGNPSRLNLISATTDSGYVAEWCDSLQTGRRDIHTTGDQHSTHIRSKAIFDGAVAGATGRGIYYLACSSGAGPRPADTTSVFPEGTTWLDSYVLRKHGVNENFGRTSEGVMDTLTADGDGEFTGQWVGHEMLDWGNAMEVRAWRVQSEDSEGADWYTGHGNLLLIDRGMLYRRVGP